MAYTPPSKPYRAAPGRTLNSLKTFVPSLQLALAVLLVVAGLTLLYLGFLLPPEGEIHSSVLVAFGETSTFAGALFGVDYRYRNADRRQA